MKCFWDKWWSTNTCLEIIMNLMKVTTLAYCVEFAICYLCAVWNLQFQLNITSMKLTILAYFMKSTIPGSIASTLTRNTYLLYCRKMLTLSTQIYSTINAIQIYSRSTDFITDTKIKIYTLKSFILWVKQQTHTTQYGMTRKTRERRPCRFTATWIMHYTETNRE